MLRSCTTTTAAAADNKGKGIPITGHEGQRGDVDARVHILTATALG